MERRQLDAILTRLAGAPSLDMTDDDRNVEIRIDRIPVGRGIGALIAIGVLLGAMLIELPELRLPAIAGVVGGVSVAVVLIMWHRRSRSKTS